LILLIADLASDMWAGYVPISVYSWENTDGQVLRVEKLYIKYRISHVVIEWKSALLGP